MNTLEKNEDFYQSLRKKVTKLAESKEGKENKFIEYLLAAPDLFHLLVKLMFDPDVEGKYKIILGTTIAYFVSPIDVLPDFIPVLGLLDDIALTAFALNGILNKGCNKEIVTKHWAGNNQDILDLITRIIQAADEMIGSGLVKKLKKLIDTDERH